MYANEHPLSSYQTNATLLFLQLWQARLMAIKVLDVVEARRG